MANMASKIRFPVDILSYFEAEGSGAHVATAGSAALSLDALASYWDAGERGFNQQVGVAINVSAMDFVNTPAANILTLTANILDTETVTIGTKVYTFQTTLTDVDGNVQLGGSASLTLDNFIAAITLTGTPGTDYALSMTVHPDVTAAAGAADTMDVTALVGGTDGNAIVVAETIVTGGVWTTDISTLVGGLDDSDEVYTFAVQVDSEEAFGDTPVIVSEFALSGLTNGASSVGNYVLAFTRDMIDELDPDSTHVRVLLTIAGSAPTATYNARAVML